MSQATPEKVRPRLSAKEARLDGLGLTLEEMVKIVDRKIEAQIKSGNQQTRLTDGDLHHSIRAVTDYVEGRSYHPLIGELIGVYRDAGYHVGQARADYRDPRETTPAALTFSWSSAT